MLRRREISDLLRPERCSLRIWPAWSPAVKGRPQPLAVLAGMSETGPHALPEDFALEGGENGQQRGHCTTRRSGQVQRLSERYRSRRRAARVPALWRADR